MKRLIRDVYKIVYRISGNKPLSLGIALSYVSTLNLIILYGMCLLLKAAQPWISIIVKFISPAVTFGLGLLMIVINLLFVLPLKNLPRDKRRPVSFGPLVVYSLASILLILYSRLAGV